jgi:trans-2,3-dihydro-3-hydroxyanthranilate isomerase
MQRRYLTTDVFTDRMFGGNPLAVVLDAEGLSTAQMQSLASEFNYAETTFVLPPKDPRHTAWVRLFTPRTEVPFAGHPNIGTAFILAREPRFGAAARAGSFTFEEAAGLVPISLMSEQGRCVGAELRAPEQLSRRALFSTEVAAACLSLPPSQLLTQRHQPQVVSVGLPFLVVEVASREALESAKPDLSVHERHLPLDGTDAVFAYWQESAGAAVANGVSSQESVLHARMFSPLDGIVEDPATGSACAAAIALLATEQTSQSAQRSWRIHQGHDMGRPSLLLGRTVRHGEFIETYVGGRCVAMMAGAFEI